MRDCKGSKQQPTPAEILQTQAASLLGTIANGVRAIETPGLGRVEYIGTDEAIRALNLLSGLASAAAGGPSRTQPVIALRGLWPRSIEGGIWQ